MKAIRLQVNHRINPLGIDDSNFRFTWNCEGGVSQTAWQLRVWYDTVCGIRIDGERHFIIAPSPAARWTMPKQAG